MCESDACFVDVCMCEYMELGVSGFVCVCEGVKKRQTECGCTCSRGRDRMCVCVCVSEREREKESMRYFNHPQISMIQGYVQPTTLHVSQLRIQENHETLELSSPSAYKTVF